MFCPNCGNKLNNDENFCSNCGYKMLQSSASLTVVENLKKNNPLNSFSKKIKVVIEHGSLFIKHHKKGFFSCVSCLLIVFISYILFQTFYDFSNIKWDENSRDYHVTYTEGGTLQLAVLAYDKKKEPIDDIVFEVTGGEISVEGSLVLWTLPKEDGEFVITAKTPSGKKVTKSVNVFSLNSEELNGVISEEIDSTTDSDNDGIIDVEEKKLNTNPYSADTDGDGLLDSYELQVSLTDPLKSVSDNDGLNDGDELTFGLNPLLEDTKSDGIKDGKRILTYQFDDEKSGIKVEMNGKGNIANTTIDTYESKAFDEVNGLLSTVYTFYTKGILDNATVVIPYSLEKLNSKGLSEDNLTLYYFNEETKALEPVKTIVNKMDQTITASLNHFSKYVIGDSRLVLERQRSDILFVIDNSISMYTEKQMIEAGYNSSRGTEGNDSTFKRLTLTNQIMDMLGQGYLFGVAEFSGNYVNIQDFTEDILKAKEKVNSMKAHWESNSNGTDIIEALEKGIAEFDNTSNSHYLMLLTDGKNTSGLLSSNQQKIIDKAQEQNVSICIIGLGSKIDTDDLTAIATETGCAYYNAKDADALDEIYATLASKINYNMVDIDKDGKVDGTVIADSSFLANRDGFSFSNFRSNKSSNGHCYGMALFAQLYYTKQLPMSLDAVHKQTLFKRFEPANAYNLADTYFENYQNLYDYEMTTDAMRFLFYERPNDYRNRIENETLMIKPEYYDLLTEIGASVYDIEYNGDGYSKYQSGLIHLDSNKFYENTSKEENQILNAIYRLFVLQVDDSRLSFDASPDKAFDTLLEKLNQNIPILTIIYNGHAINATKIIQDNDDANRFYIEVYDNNNPGETRYIEMQRSKMNKIQFSYTAWTNDYSYTFKYDKDNDGILDEITVSLSEPIIE